MFKFLRRTPASPLVEKTKLSSFVREASAGEKKQIYKRVIEKANAEQEKILRAAESQRIVDGRPALLDKAAAHKEPFDDL